MNRRQQQQYDHGGTDLHRLQPLSKSQRGMGLEQIDDEAKEHISWHQRISIWMINEGKSLLFS